MALDLNYRTAITTLVNNRPAYEPLVRLTSSVVQPPRGWANQTDVLLPLFPGQEIDRSLRKPAPVPQNLLR